MFYIAVRERNEVGTKANRIRHLRNNVLYLRLPPTQSHYPYIHQGKEAQRQHRIAYRSTDTRTDVTRTRLPIAIIINRLRSTTWTGR